MISCIQNAHLEADYNKLLKEKKIHVVTFAYLALTNAHEYLKAVISDQDKRFELVSKVCREKETGTLFPVANLTLIPVEYLHYPVMGGEQISETDYSREDFEMFIEDAFKAELEYVKSGKMVFDFRDKQIRSGNQILVDPTSYNIVEEMIQAYPLYGRIECEFLL